MARNRTPKRKALVAGAHLNHPERFKNRSAPTNTKPLGKPYASMTVVEQRYWKEFESELPWLHSSHRVLLRLACKLAARMDDGGLGVSAAHALSSILSKLGATPVDETKVNHGDAGDETDEGEAFFSRPH